MKFSEIITKTKEVLLAQENPIRGWWAYKSSPYFKRHTGVPLCLEGSLMYVLNGNKLTIIPGRIVGLPDEEERIGLSLEEVQETPVYKFMRENSPKPHQKLWEWYDDNKVKNFQKIIEWLDEVAVLAKMKGN